MYYFEDNDLMFFHIPKTGGTSFAAFLKKELFKYNGHKKHKVINLENYHEPLANKIKAVGEEAFYNSTVIAIVRNPYDVVVSLYFWYKRKYKEKHSDLKTYPHVKKIAKMSFDDYIDWYVENYSNFKEYLLVDDKLPDNVRLLRLEHLEEDAKKLLIDELGIDIKVKIPVFEGTTSKHKEALYYFNDSTLEKINNKFDWMFSTIYKDKKVNSMDDIVKGEKNILIDGAGTVTCQSVIKGLRQQKEFKTKIVTMDMSSDNAGKVMSDSFYIVPPAKSKTFLDEVLQIIEKENIDVIVPIIDYSFEVLSKNKEFIESKTKAKLVISSPKVIEICNDKLKFIDFINATFKGSIKTPNIVGPKVYPNFVRPRFDGRASIGCYKVEDLTDLLYVKKHVSNPLHTEYVDAEEYTVDTLCDLDGNWVGGLVRKRTMVKSGVSYKAEVVHDDVILEQAEKIVTSLPIIGPANLQCFKTEDTILWFEINPRFSGTLAASIGAGFNSPHLLLKIVENLTISNEDVSYNDVLMVRYWQEFFIDV